MDLARVRLAEMEKKGSVVRQEPSPCCPNCGCQDNVLLANLLKNLKENARENYDEKPENLLILDALPELKPPLGPVPFPPYFSTTAVFLVLFVVVTVAGVENLILHILLVVFSTMGIYYGILKPRHELKLAIWREQTEGAYLCTRCHSLFK